MGNLTDKAIQAAKPKDKQYGINDGDGLTLIIKPNGTKLWWVRYRFDNKAKTLSLGEYPLVSLREARDKTFYAKKTLVDGFDPSARKREDRQARLQQRQPAVIDVKTTFEYIALEWFEKFRVSKKWAEGHASKIRMRLEKDMFPYIGKQHIGTIQPQELFVAPSLFRTI